MTDDDATHDHLTQRIDALERLTGMLFRHITPRNYDDWNRELELIAAEPSDDTSTAVLSYKVKERSDGPRSDLEPPIAVMDGRPIDGFTLVEKLYELTRNVHLAELHAYDGYCLSVVNRGWTLVVDGAVVFHAIGEHAPDVEERPAFPKEPGPLTDAGLEMLINGDVSVIPGAALALMAKELKDARAVLKQRDHGDYIDFVFRGGDSREGSLGMRFLETQDSDRRAISMGSWVTDGPGARHRLRIPFAARTDEHKRDRELLASSRGHADNLIQDMVKLRAEVSDAKASSKRWQDACTEANTEANKLQAQVDALQADVNRARHMLGTMDEPLGTTVQKLVTSHAAARSLITSSEASARDQHLVAVNAVKERDVLEAKVESIRADLSKEMAAHLETKQALADADEAGRADRQQSKLAHSEVSTLRAENARLSADLGEERNARGATERDHLAAVVDLAESLEIQGVTPDEIQVFVEGSAIPGPLRIEVDEATMDQIERRMGSPRKPTSAMTYMFSGAGAAGGVAAQKTARPGDQTPPAAYDPSKPLAWREVIRRATEQGLHGSLIADMTARHEMGMARYGVPLQPFNGRDTIRDLYEELLDACAYAASRAIENRGEHGVPSVDYTKVVKRAVNGDSILGELLALTWRVKQLLKTP